MSSSTLTLVSSFLVAALSGFRSRVSCLHISLNSLRARGLPSANTARTTLLSFPVRAPSGPRYWTIRLSSLGSSLRSSFSTSAMFRRRFQSSSSTCSMYSSQTLHLSHRLLFTTLQLKAQPTTCQKSSARAHRLSILARSVFTFSASWATGLAPSPALLRALPPRREDVSALVNAKASRKLALTGPTCWCTNRKYRRARLAACNRSADLARMVREG